MYLDPVIPQIVIFSLIILVVGLILKLLKQPAVIGYILVGILLGPYALKFFTDIDLISRIGSFGVVILLFVIGTEISLDKLVSNWKVSLVGTFMQIMLSIGFTFLLGTFFQWSFKLRLLLGFVISLSSTAVVLNLLKSRNELNTPVGQHVLGILLAQDIAIVPMLIIINTLGSSKVSSTEIIVQIIGGGISLVFLYWLLKKKQVKLPLGNKLHKDHELQVFYTLILCFGAALLTGFFGLSTALGAFFAGLLISKTKDTDWIKENIHSFYVVFIAIFFVSIGLLMDINFIKQNFVTIMLIVFGVFLTNTFINALILRFLKVNWKDSLFSGALLAQIGEFSFLLAALGVQTGIIANFGYQMTLSIIALSLFFSPFWISLFKRICKC